MRPQWLHSYTSLFFPYDDWHYSSKDCGQMTSVWLRRLGDRLPWKNTMLRGTWQFWNTRSGILGSIKISLLFFESTCKKHGRKTRNHRYNGITCPSVWVPSAHGHCLPGRGKLWVEQWSYWSLAILNIWNAKPPWKSKVALHKNHPNSTRFSVQNCFRHFLGFVHCKNPRWVPQHLCSRQSFPSPAGLELEVSTRIIVPRIWQTWPSRSFCVPCWCQLL